MSATDEIGALSSRSPRPKRARSRNPSLGPAPRQSGSTATLDQRWRRPATVRQGSRQRVPELRLGTLFSSVRPSSLPGPDVCFDIPAHVKLTRKSPGVNDDRVTGDWNEMFVTIATQHRHLCHARIDMRRRRCWMLTPVSSRDSADTNCTPRMRDQHSALVSPFLTP